ncbi:hypothetical protein pb186bvf_016479 [Paramecium bursaria]
MIDLAWPDFVNRFFKWEMPKFWPTSNDGIKLWNPLTSPVNRLQYAAWHQKPDTVHDHTVQYRLLKAICDNDLIEAELALNKQPELLNQTFTDGFTPLSLSSSLNRTGFIEGADIDVIDKQGRTPLIQAIINWQIDSIKILTERGAQIKKAGAYGYDALQLAQMKGYEQIAKFLEFQLGKNIKPNYPEFQITFDFERKLNLYKQTLQQPEGVKVHPMPHPFNDFEGQYKISYFV